MKPEYAAWIAAYELKGSVAGRCYEAATLMAEVFPELRVVAGHVYAGWAHWWCVDAEGSIIDPTASQFGAPSAEVYVELQPGDPVRVGRCANCGDPLFARSEEEARTRSRFCDPDCESETADYLNRRLGDL